MVVFLFFIFEKKEMVVFVSLQMHLILENFVSRCADTSLKNSIYRYWNQNLKRLLDEGKWIAGETIDWEINQICFSYPKIKNLLSDTGPPPLHTIRLNMKLCHNIIYKRMNNLKKCTNSLILHGKHVLLFQLIFSHRCQHEFASCFMVKHEFASFS